MKKVLVLFLALFLLGNTQVFGQMCPTANGSTAGDIDLVNTPSDTTICFSDTLNLVVDGTENINSGDVYGWLFFNVNTGNSYYLYLSDVATEYNLNLTYNDIVEGYTVNGDYPNGQLPTPAIPAGTYQVQGIVTPIGSFGDPTVSCITTTNVQVIFQACSLDNNECTGAFDISDAFNIPTVGTCMPQVLGPYTNVGATVEMSDINFTGFTGTEVDVANGTCCTCESENNGTMPIDDLNNSVWFVFTPPVSGTFLIEATAMNSSGNGCGSTLGTFEDTQILIYESTDSTCNSLTFFDCNEDGPSSVGALYPAGVEVSLTGGTTYYMLVDEYADPGPESGEFCIEVTAAAPGQTVPDCATCPDTQCATAFGEGYCTCSADCDCADETSFVYGLYNGTNFNLETDPTTNDLLVCAGVFGLDPAFVYVPIFLSTPSCATNGGSGDDYTVTYISSTGGPVTLVGGGTIASGGTYDADFINFLGFDPNGGSGIITLEFTSLNDPGCVYNTSLNGTIINTADFTGSVFCVITCAPGDIDPALDNQTVCPLDDLMLGTDGMEDLTLPCASDDGSGYQYGWSVAADTDGDGTFDTFVTPVFTFDDGAGTPTPNVTVVAGNIMIDAVDALGNGANAPLPPGDYLVCGIAGCFNSDGSGVETCTTPNCINVTLLDSNDPVACPPPAGDIDPDILALGPQILCPDDPIFFGTDGTEPDLSTQNCPTGSDPTYLWFVGADIDGTGTFTAGDTTVIIFPFGSTPADYNQFDLNSAGANSSTVFVYPSSHPQAGQPLPPGTYLMFGAAACVDATTGDISIIDFTNSDIPIVIRDPLDPACAPPNDDCANAIDISALFDGTAGTMTAGPFSNVNATVAPDDPEPACWGEPGFGGTILNHTVWFTFTITTAETYFIEMPGAGIPDDDTQLAIYTGGCGNYTLYNPAGCQEACNEDGPNAVNGSYPAGITILLEPGTYYMLMDGFDCSNPTDCGGVVSVGDFNIDVTESAPTCAAGDVDTGLSGSLVCNSDVVPFATNGCEDISIACPGGVYSYDWGLIQDVNGDGAFDGGDNVIGLFNVNDLGTAGNSTLTLDQLGLGNLPTGDYLIYGGAICRDSNGDAVDMDGDGSADNACFTPGEIAFSVNNKPVIDVLTANGCDFSATISGGSTDYNWEVLMGADSTSFTPPVAGTSSDGSIAVGLPDGSAFVLTITDANGCVADSAFTVDPACVNCPSLNTGLATTADACGTGNTVDLTALVDTAAVANNPTNATFNWYTDAAFTTAVADPTTAAADHSTGTGCDSETITYYLQLGCSSDAAFSEAAGTHTLTLYPIPVGGTDYIEPPASACNPAVAVNCATASVLYDNDGDGTYSDTAGPAASTGSVVNYQVAVNGAPAGCSVTGSYTLECVTDCPTVTTAAQETADVCGSGTVDLTTATIAFDDPQGLATGITWYSDAALTTPVADATAAAAAHSTGTGCTPETVTYYAGLGCTLTSTDAGAGTYTITVYPIPSLGASGEFTLPPDGSCVASVNLLCTGATVYYDTDGDTSNGYESTDAPTAVEDLVVNYFVQVDGAPAGCGMTGDFTVSGCIGAGDCPTVTASAEGTADVCNSGTIDLTQANASITYDDPKSLFDGITWYTDAALTTPVADATAASVTHAAGSGCGVETTTFYAGVGCTLGDDAAAGTYVVSAYPSPVAGTDFTAPTGCATAVAVTCTSASVLYDNDGDGTYSDASPPAPANGATVNYSVQVDGAPAGCATTGSYTASGCTDCPVVTSPLGESSDLCGGGTADLTALEANITISDPSNQSAGFNWYTDAGLTTAVADASAAAIPAPNGCDVGSVTYYVGLACTMSSDIAAAGSVTYTSYPTPSATISLSGDGCTLTASPDCPDYAIDGGAAGADATANASGVGDQSSVTFVVTDTRSAVCGSVDAPGTFDCKACPTLEVSGDVDACSGDAVVLTATVTSPETASGDVEWTLDGASIGSGNSITTSAVDVNGCNNETRTYVATIGCNIAGTDPISASHTVTYYPTPDTASVAVSNGGCTLTPQPNCAGFTIDPADFSATPGTGSATFTITNPNAPAGLACQSGTVTVDYDCKECPTIDPIDDVDACEDGGDITLTAAVTDNTGSGTIVGWEEVGSGAGANGAESITITPPSVDCNPVTATYRFTVDCSIAGPITEEVNITFYPGIEVSVALSADGCTLTPSANCPTFTIDDPATTDVAGNTDEVTFTATNPNAPSGLSCASASASASFDCKVCPTVASITDGLVACSGESLDLSVALDDVSGQLAGVVWTDANSNIVSEELDAVVSETVEGCNPVDFQYTVTIACALGGDPIVQQVTATFYPQPTATIVSGANGCELTAITDCNNFTISADGADSGTSVTVSTDVDGDASEVVFTVTNDEGGAGNCLSAQISANFSCVVTDFVCPSLDIESLVAPSVVCTGATFDLSIGVLDPDARGFTLDWVDADGVSVGDGTGLSATATDCNVATVTYTAVLTPTDAECQTVELPVSVSVLPELVMEATGNCEEGYVFGASSTCNLAGFAVTATPAGTDAGLMDAGSVEVTLTYDDLPDCGAAVDTFSYDCTPTDCPTITVSGGGDVCSGNEATLSVNIDDPFGQAGEVSWTVAGSDEVLSTDTTLVVAELVTSCNAQTITYQVTVACTSGDPVSGLVDVTYYPAPSATASLSPDGCTLTFSPDCADFSIDGGEAGADAVFTTDVDEDMSEVTVSITGSASCESVSTSAAYNCIITDCPTLSVSDNAISCSGGEVTLEATIDDPDGLLTGISWSIEGANDVLSDQATATVTHETLGCDPETVTYIVTISCAEGPDESATISVTYYPTPSLSVTSDATTCTITATPDCPSFEIDGAAAGESVVLTAEAGMTLEAEFSATNTAAVAAGLDCGVATASGSVTCAEEPVCEQELSASGEVNCNDDGSGTGTYTLTVTGGVPPYDVPGFTDNGDGTYSTAFANGDVISVIITDSSNGLCAALDFTDDPGSPCEVIEPCEEDLAASGSFVCNDDNSGTGSYTLTVTGGVAPYTVTANEGSLSLTDNGDGTYSTDFANGDIIDVTISDSSESCGDIAFDAAPFCMTDDCPDPINVSGSLACSDAQDGTGTYTIAVSGGTPPYSVAGFDDNGDGTFSTAYANGDIINAIVSDNGLCPDVSYSDAPDDCPVVIPCDDPISAEGSLACDGETGTGTYTITVSGGTPPYSVSGFDATDDPAVFTAAFANGDVIEATISGSGTCPDVIFNDTPEDCPTPAENEPPVASMDTIVLVGGGSGFFTPDDFASDPDGDDLTVTDVAIVGPDDAGTIEIDEEGNVVFTPSEGFEGEVTITFTVSDGTAEATGQAVFIITDICANFTATVEALVLPEGTYTLYVFAEGGAPQNAGEGTYTVLVDGSEYTATYGSVLEIAGELGGASQANLTVEVIDEIGGCSTTITKLISIVLSVELIDFSGEVLTEGNALKWVTASEKDNDYFTLYRSTDGSNYEAVATIAGNGTTPTGTAYQHLDKDAPAGLSYYRLDQTDFDGTTSTVGMLTLERGESNFGIVEVAPVPARNFVNIDFTATIATDITANIYDVTGRLVSSKVIGTNAGTNRMTVDVTNFAAGVYFVTITDGTEVIGGKFTKE